MIAKTIRRANDHAYVLTTPVSGPLVLGLDVSKATVVIYDARSRQTLTAANTLEALKAALAPFASHGLAVCEATGGYERAVLQAAHSLGLAIHRADAAKVKAFIASHGGRAKTDALDAAWLAAYGQERGVVLARWSPPEEAREAFGELVRHRQDLLAERTRAKNRLAAPTGAAVRDLITDQIAFLTQQIKAIDARLRALEQAHDTIAQPVAALQDVSGFGPVIARTLVALVPELGSITAKQSASLTGLAPHPHDSGAHCGRRRTGHGRTGLKPALFMAALSAARYHPRLKDFYQRLIAKGKPKRLALAAVARKLVTIANAILRDLKSHHQELT